jgi:4-carboxymuconolactone decarboxylase
MMTPRIAPVALEEADAGTRTMLEPVGGVAATNFIRTLVRHPRVFKTWMRYGDVLINGALPARDRELLVLRATHRSASAYQWSHHEPIAKRSGLTEQEIARVRGGPKENEWDPFDAALLLAADELIDLHAITDATWQILAERYDERQLIEVPIIVGVHYSMGAALNSYGIELEHEIP